MGQFLSLIGLAALAIAGIGVSNGVASYLAIKRNGIATLKILGASSADIARIYLMQIGAVAVLAIGRSEEHTSELQSLMRISYAVFCLKKKKKKENHAYN